MANVRLGRFQCGAWFSVLFAFLAMLLSGIQTASADVPRFVYHAAPGFQTALSNRTLTIEVLTDTLIHFEIALDNTSPILTSPMILKKDYSGPTEMKINPTGFQTAAARVQVDPNTFCMDVFDLTHNTKLTTLCPSAAQDQITLSQEQMQNVYGLGEQFRNLGNPNGDWIGTTRTPGGPDGNSMVAFGGGATGNAQFPIMYALGAQDLNYALFLDDVYGLTWDFTTTTWNVQHLPQAYGQPATAAKAFRGYFILGKNLPALRTQYMDLIGHAPVPPKKAFGLWVSEFGYRNWGEIDGHLKTLREHKFPIDGFVLDLYWYGGYTANSPDSDMGNYAWDTVNFPNTTQKIATYKDQSGIGLMLIEESYVSQGKSDFSLLSPRGFLAKTGSSSGSSAIMDGWWGHGGMLDWTNDQGTAYWHDLMRKPLTDQGITFHWTDLGEPESYNNDNWYVGFQGYGNSEADIQNLYNFKWDQSISDGYKRNEESQRHFIMSRSGTSGSQRWGAGMWSGDIGSNLRSLASHLNVQMQMSLSGMDYFGADVGGFHREALEGNINDVYTRWLAHASWFDVPVRPHTDDGSKKNYTAPDQIGDMPSNLFNLRQRYELAPYYYSLAHQVYETGAPLVPPLVYYFQEDPNVRIIAEEKMVGPSLLVSTAAQLGENNRGIYLPAGDWSDYHTGTWYHSAGQWFPNFALYVNGVFELPVMARAGAILPKAVVDAKTMNILGKRTDGSRETSFNVEVFSSKTQSFFDVVEDDGVSELYKSGELARTPVSQQERDGNAWVNIAPTEGTYAGAPSSRSFQVQWVGENHPVKSVKLNGQTLLKCFSATEFAILPEGYYDSGVLGVFAKSVSMNVADTKTFEFDF